MTDISQFLTAEHAHCDDLFVEAENAVASTDWQGGQTRFQDFEAATLHHFLREESVLFPAFEARTGMSHGPTAVMRGEHTEMRETLQGMRPGQGIRFLIHREPLPLYGVLHHMGPT